MGELTGWPCDDYEAPLTCWTTPKQKTLICTGCRNAFPKGPEVQRIFAARRESLADRVKALADEWTHATCQTDGAPCSWHRVSAECADELLALLDPSETP